ncbi:DAK2 domain-containing protein [Cryptosporangium phraense]|uniref:DAK2 domain-containing protein n=1 Tax=Cryptosporangium phraense TaxID=2593070 RepID=A0A545ASF2_9ACTN|nr:DAK2 domain-containing protein [Cryptosporangium phraense]TQS44266.1 DAK2 domain-containing protein [Cryptosporangium phraense]
MLDSLDAGAVRRWCAGTLSALRRSQREIDALNVFPVADSDTGTNLVLTLQAAVDALPDTGGPREVWAAMARGALLGARGNSGMILSQLLAGAAAALPSDRPVGGRALATALTAAVDAGYSAVAQPVEGTVLSVAGAAARAATEVDTDALPTVSAAALEAARRALESTPAQLAAMGLPGVVDAGGRGLVVMLDVLDTVVRGAVVDLAAPEPEPVPAAGVQEGWEIQYLLASREPDVPGLAKRLSEIGDSVVVAYVEPSLWSVHVHADDIGAALEAGLELGRPHQVAVTPLIARVRTASASGRAIVAVVPGAGLAAVFAAAGAVPVEGAPRSDELLSAIERMGADEVVLLPNSDAHVPVAEEAAAAAGATVSVLHTRSVVQGIAALAVADRARSFRDDVVAMAEAAAATRWAEVVIADEAGLTMAGPCRVGDVLGLVDGDVAAIGVAVPDVVTNVLDRLLNAGGELVTVVLGAAAGPSLEAFVQAHLHTHWPFCEVHVIDGGQPRAVVVIGVE